MKIFGKAFVPVFALAVIAVMFFASACGGKENDGNDGADPAEPKVTLLEVIREPRNTVYTDVVLRRAAAGYTETSDRVRAALPRI